MTEWSSKRNDWVRRIIKDSWETEVSVETAGRVKFQERELGDWSSEGIAG